MSRACRAGVAALVLAGLTACAARQPEGHYTLDLASGQRMEIVTGPIGLWGSWTVWFLPSRLDAQREVRLAEVRQVWQWLQQDVRLAGVSRVSIRPAQRQGQSESRGEAGAGGGFVVGDAFVYQRDSDGWCEADGFRPREALRPCAAPGRAPSDGRR